MMNETIDGMMNGIMNETIDGIMNETMNDSLKVSGYLIL